MMIVFIVFCVLIAFQSFVSIFLHIRKQRTEKQRIEATLSLALAMERLAFDPNDFSSIKRYISALLDGLEHHERILGDVLAGNEARNAKIKLERIIEEGKHMSA